MLVERLAAFLGTFVDFIVYDDTPDGSRYALTLPDSAGGHVCTDPGCTRALAQATGLAELPLLSATTTLVWVDGSLIGTVEADLAALIPETRERLIAHMARGDGITEAAMADRLEAHGLHVRVHPVLTLTIPRPA